MPDNWGRPTMDDGLRFARSMMSIRQFNQEQEDRARKRAREEKVQQYLNMIGQGQEPDRKAKDFDYGAYLSATTQVAKSKFMDENTRRMRLENDMKEIEANQQDIDQRIAMAQNLYSQGNEQKAWEVLTPIYNYVPDGFDFEGFKPGTNNQVMILRDPTGKQVEQEAPSFDEALAMAQGLSKNYRKTILDFREKVRAKNLEMLEKPQIWRSKDGKVKAFYIVGIDPRTGKMIESWKDPKTGKTIKGFDARTGKQVESNVELYPEDYYGKQLGQKATRAAIKLHEAQAKAAGQKAAGGGKGGSKNKDIEYIQWLMKAYNIDEAKATDLFRNDKSLRERLQGYSQYMESHWTADENEMKAIEAKARKMFRLDEAGGNLPPEKEKSILDHLSSKYPPEKQKEGTRVSVNGYIFTVRNGKWTR